jgi:UDP-N-acetylglucosamine 3-dehydrogenase
MSAGTAPVRVTFLGCGAVTRMHARTLGRMRGDGIACAFASASPDRARAYAEAHGGAAWFGSYDDALADPKTDVVVVATPPSTHFELAMRALGAKKHVVVEKPAVLAAAELDVVAAMAAVVDRRVFVAENYFYKPLARALRRLVARDALGDILCLHVNALKRQATDGWRNDRLLAGGGALFEGGIHWVNLLANLGLTVRRVTASRPGAQQGPERSVLVSFEYAEGAIGTLLYSWDVPSLPGGLRLSRIFGTRGSATFESNGVFLWARGLPMRLRLPSMVDGGGYRAMFRDFFRALRTGDEPAMTLAVARRDLELVEAAYRAIAKDGGGSAQVTKPA